MHLFQARKDWGGSDQQQTLEFLKLSQWSVRIRAACVLVAACWIVVCIV
jgi:hypothetical protein